MGFLDWFLGREAPPGGAQPTAALVSGTRYVVVDTELTGLDPRKDDIVSIGALRMSGGRLEIGGSFYELVRPSATLDGKSIVIHGITPTQVAGKPPIDSVLAAFTGYCGNDVLVGHCLSIDLSFLNREARRLFGGPLHNPVVDTLSIYGWLRNRQAGHPIFSSPLNGLRLYDMAKGFGISCEGAHDALADAFITAQLFQRFIPILEGFGIRDLDDLLRIGNPGMQGENLFSPGGRANF
ncbi:MAG TPA: 3'-5' exonuclease [Candidatus Deferrimicrobiaceae bacterium]